VGTWKHTVAGREAVETWPDELDGYYAAQPGYSRVLTESEREQLRARLESEVKALKGAELDAAAEDAGVDPRLPAEEKRAAIVDARATTTNSSGATIDISPGAFMTVETTEER
jgi:hypothetical protein